MEEKNVKRSKFSSNLGMMLACIGGAVGLGNVFGVSPPSWAAAAASTS